jgi:peptidoglycan/LPS O-acetylase OafA/YrhL
MRYDGIQCLRAVAAILVVWAHLKFAGDFPGSSFVATAAGAVGVDVFFVISGFVIPLSAERLNCSWRPFLTNRLCRIVPFYWLMSAPLAVALMIRHVELNLHSAANTVLFIPLFDFRAFQLPIHGFGWTLSFEFWFYTLFAALLALLGSRALIVISPLLAILCVLVHFGYKGAWFTPNFLFNPFTLEFAAGVLLYRARKFGSIWTLAASLILVAILGWATLKTEALGWHLQVLADPLLGFKRDLIWGGFGVALVSFVLSVDDLKLLTWPRWLVWLGDCSYSIYLMQPFALMAARVSQVHLAARPIVSCAVFVTVAVLGGAILSKYIEMPLIRWVKRKVTSRSLPNGPSPQAV